MATSTLATVSTGSHHRADNHGAQDTRSRQVVAMERRMRALIRKAEPSLSARPELTSQHFKEGFVQLLGSLVHNKREYSEMFETPEATESFAIKRGFSDAQKDLLLAMQANKDIFVPNQLLDGVCTFIFLAECAYIAHHLMGQGFLWVFLGLLFLTDCVITRVKASSQVIGSHLSAWVHRKGYVDVDPLSGQIQMKKWTEQSWQLFLHVVFSAIELRILSEENWYDQPANCWIPHPYDQIGNHRTDLVILYLTQLAVWVYTCIIHRFFDERRKDYFVMYVHHIVTIMLVAGSYAAGYLRIGLLVLWVHDVSDILVDVLKMVNYLKMEARQGFFASEIAYASCVAGWVYWRLYRFPFTAIRGALVEAFRVVAPQPRLSWAGALDIMVRDMPLYFEMNGLLLTLQALHVYWFYLFAMIGYRILTESAREASRQEYEGDSDDETTSGAKKQLAAKAAAAAGAGTSSGRSDEAEGRGADSNTLRQRKK